MGMDVPCDGYAMWDGCAMREVAFEIDAVTEA
jgi:hypothetical protein